MAMEKGEFRHAVKEYSHALTSVFGTQCQSLDY